MILVGGIIGLRSRDRQQFQVPSRVDYRIYILVDLSSFVFVVPIRLISVHAIFAVSVSLFRIVFHFVPSKVGRFPPMLRYAPGFTFLHRPYMINDMIAI